MHLEIAYNSAGGNTRRVAQALAEGFTQAGAQVETVEIGKDSVDEALARAKDADAVLVGFWCDKGSCTDEVTRVLEGMSGKRVFLFGTAGFGGSAEYFDRILSGVRAKLPADAEYLGGVMCQGKMGPGVRRRYEAMLEKNPDDARIKGMIENFDAALGHPDEEDLARIVKAALTVLGL